MKLGRVLPSAPQLNFVAGLFAAAGINMLTSVSTGDSGQASSLKIGVDSFFWVLAAGFLTWAARILEDAERDAARLIDQYMSKKEEVEIRDLRLRSVAPRAVRALALSGLSLLIAVMLLPGLIHWSRIVGY